MTKGNRKGVKGDIKWTRLLKECERFPFAPLARCLACCSGINRLTRNFERAIPVVDDAIRSGFLFQGLP